MLVVCHCFGRVEFRKNSPYLMQERIKNTSSVVVLPSLPQKAVNVLKHHNALIVDVFKGYAITYSQQHAASLPAETCLPLSRLSFPTDTPDCSPFINQMKNRSIPLRTRSVFAGQSGHTDDFHNATIKELVESVREGVHLNKHAVPTFDMFTAKDEDIALNAYAFDFFKHGSVPDLLKGNGIKRGNVWYLLQNLSLCIATAKEAIWNVLVEAAKKRGVADESDEGVMELQNELEAEGEAKEDIMERPASVKQGDWNIYVAISLLKQEFDEKFRKIWA
ncbi:hypothetical protein BT69DRAFT_1349371 [Atractiella rhizophila]|nr:hypothetical protein BT69DRAFT_1349371 [Atractiella rhizophila]